jgi:hypothetical protein
MTPGKNVAGGNAKIANTVADVVANALDSGGEPIDCVYFKRLDYAIYRRGTPPQVVVAYSDNPATADQQIVGISVLLPQRDHLLRLIDKLPPKAEEHYRAQIADALRLGLEKQVDTAKALLAEAIHHAHGEQGRRGRLVYLQWAAFALVPALILILWGGSYVRPHSGVHLLVMATGAGALGAILSISIGISARAVAIAGDWWSNAMDAAVRVGIGMICALVLFLLLNSGILAKIEAGGVPLTGSGMTWQVALVVGIAAGFLERLVPDLLDSGAPSPPPSASSPAKVSAGVAPPTSH